MPLALVLNRRRQAPLEESAAFAHVAERFRRAGELQRAVSLCRDGLRRFPDHVSARVTLGLALLDLEQYQDAREELQEALKRAPDNLAAIRGLAQLHDHGEGDVSANGSWQMQEEVDSHPLPPPLAVEPEIPEIPEIAEIPEVPEVSEIPEISTADPAVASELFPEPSSQAFAYAPASVEGEDWLSALDGFDSAEPIGELETPAVIDPSPEVRTYLEALPLEPDCPPRAGTQNFEIEDLLAASGSIDLLDPQAAAEGQDDEAFTESLEKFLGQVRNRQLLQ